MNSELTQMTVNGHAKESVEKLINRFGYINTKSKPLVGTSLVSLLTLVT